MRILRTRHLLVLVTATLAIVISSSPVVAYRHLGTTGSTGTHGLTDTRSSPGADCLYRFSDVGTAWELRRINVDPPNAQASAFQEGTQRVGWKFTVERQTVSAFSDEPGPWEHRYTSPVMKATTDADHDAAFSPMGVRVTVPDEASSDVKFFYRVIIKAIWYRDSGGVSGTGRMRVAWFKSFMGNDSTTQRWSCRSHVE